MFINIPNEANQHIINSIKISIIDQLKREGLISETEFYVLKNKIVK